MRDVLLAVTLEIFCNLHITSSNIVIRFTTKNVEYEVEALTNLIGFSACILRVVNRTPETNRDRDILFYIIFYILFYIVFYMCETK